LNTQDRILTGHSFAKDPRVAVQEFHAAVSGPNLTLVIFFCSSHYDLETLASEMNALFPNVTVVGCTTAGEIGPAGYRDYSLSGASFPASSCLAIAGHYDELQQFEYDKGYDFVNSLLQQLEDQRPDVGPKNSFAFMLIDGLSKREEPVVNTFQKALGNIGLFGGSAGDDQIFKQTWVFCDGAFRTDSVALILINTIYPFKLFKAQHFISSQERLVVTKADLPQRTVIEINGLPAAEEYARLLGTSVEHLDATQFAANPVVVRINGIDYVRAINRANPDRSLTFYCAIDKGIVLRMAHGVNFIPNLEQTFASIRTEIGPLQFTLACDCLLRQLEMIDNSFKGAVEEIFKKNNVIGFSTYGEQFMGVHINQTITGLAIGEQKNLSDV
jgi:hypothetical protein